jgi:putative transposase
MRACSLSSRPPISRPLAVATLERGFDDATAVLALPRPYRKRLRTTNGQERLNEEIRRRGRVIRIFPNRQSTMRLLGAMLMEQDEQWSTGNRYFDMTAYWQWQAGTADTSTTTAERQPVDQKEQHVRQHELP